MIMEFPKEDLFIPLKRDVSTHHIIEQHPQGPHSGRKAMVFVVFDPFRWAVHSGACRNRA